MKVKRIVSAFLTLVMVLGSLVISVDAAYEDKIDENGDPIIDYMSENYASADAKLADMILVKEQNGYQLWYEEFTGEIAVVDLATGVPTFSNPWNLNNGYQGISEAVKQQLMSQLIITYLENDVQKTMNSYYEAALRNQITKKNIKNGIRVEYILGEEQTTRLVPRLIRTDRMDTLILENIDDDWLHEKFIAFYTKKDKDDESLTERGVAEMIAKFPITAEMPVYVCDPDIKARELRELENIVKNFCPLYTYEELDYDHEITRYTGADAAPPRFRMSIEYTLNDWGLEARLPAAGIDFDESAYKFQTVSFLPFFGAGSNEHTGYTFIPDGSGALIRHEQFKGQSVNLSGQLYGSDYAYHEISGQHAESMRMPVYGVVTDYPFDIHEKAAPEEATDSGAAEIAATAAEEEPTGYTNGYFAIITEGDSLASLMAVCGGSLHPYNSVYPMFTPRPSDEYNLADSISVSGSATWTVTSKRKYTNSYRVQFVFLTDKKVAEENGIKDYYSADWVGMATAYRDYLTEKGDLVKMTGDQVKDDVPLFIETFGSTKTTERVLSFPIEVDTPLTTFDDIKTMYTELTDTGIKNVNFKLTGYANGGLSPTVPYRLKWMKVVGGNKGFTDLVDYAKEKNFDVYPDFDFVYIRNQTLFDGISLKQHAVRTIDDRYTTRRAYDAATQSFDRSFAIAISPAYFDRLYKEFGPNYLSYGNDSIAVSTLGTDLNSDFDEDEPYHREDDKEFTLELLENIKNDYANVMIEEGNAYAVKYADVILKTSLTSSNYVKASESVPFKGMVYHASKVFTGSATNMEGDLNESILHAIENGAAMYFILSYQNTSVLKEDFRMSKYYSVAYEIWKDDVAQYYNMLNDAIKDLQTSYIVDHEFLSAERVPDEDEAEADRIAEEIATAEAKAEEEAKAEKAARAQRLKERLDAEAAAAAGEVTEEPATEEETTETPPEEEAPQETVIAANGREVPAGYTLGEDGLTLFDENGEEVPWPEEEAAEAPDKYKTQSGTVVRVEYEGNVNFILNYNSFEIKVTWNGQTYTIAPLSYERIG